MARWIWALMAAGVLIAVAGFATAQPTRTGEPRLESSSPAAGAVLSTAPARVQLTFSEPVEANLTHVVVADRAGEPLNAGGFSLAAPATVSQPVRSSVTGPLTVWYHATFRNGYQLSGSVDFVVGAAVSPAAAGVDAPPPSLGHAHAIDPLGATLLVLDGAVALGAVVLLLVTRRRPRRLTPGVR